MEESSNEDNFKEVFKYYKRRKPPPDFSKVLQVQDSFQGGNHIKPRSLTGEEEEVASALGLIPHKCWKIFNFNSHPDLLIIRNPFSNEGQLKWIQTCLTEYPRNPNKTNLESHGIMLSDASWWEQATSTEGIEKDLMKKLRWATLGYHHNWDTKEYSEDMRNSMPQDLKKLCNLVTKVLGIEDFSAEAAIINFYHEDSSLGPHTDHSEPNMTAPLLSFSFGQSAVFLIGDSTKRTRPTALYLHSGDVLIMTGTTRLAYHAIPRIVLVEEAPWSTRDINNYDPCPKDITSCCAQGFSMSAEKQVECNKYFRYVLEYIKTSRINMNVRQVLLPSMKNLSCQ